MLFIFILKFKLLKLVVKLKVKPFIIFNKLSIITFLYCKLKEIMTKKERLDSFQTNKTIRLVKLT